MGKHKKDSLSSCGRPFTHKAKRINPTKKVTNIPKTKG